MSTVIKVKDNAYLIAEHVVSFQLGREAQAQAFDEIPSVRIKLSNGENMTLRDADGISRFLQHFLGEMESNTLED